MCWCLNLANYFILYFFIILGQRRRSCQQGQGAAHLRPDVLPDDDHFTDITDAQGLHSQTEGQVQESADERTPDHGSDVQADRSSVRPHNVELDEGVDVLEGKRPTTGTNTIKLFTLTGRKQL